MLNRNSYPTKYDSYGRHITREAGMDTPIKMNCNSVTASDIKNNNCSCNNSSNSSTSNDANNTYADVTNHAMYLKYANVRIKFVGFIYNQINYIVDLDNRKVLYKSLKESKYQQLAKRVNVTSDSLTKSYKLGFHLYNESSVANVEVYPNDIENCNVTIVNLNTHETEILDKNYIAYEFFDAKNMLDECGNIITFVNYQDIFKLTAMELMTLFTYTESIDFIKNVLDSVLCNKDLVVVVQNLLTEIKQKICRLCKWWLRFVL